MYEAVFLLAVVLVLWLGLDGAFLRVLCLAALLIEGIWWLNWELSSKAEGGPAWAFLDTIFRNVSPVLLLRPV
jgi:hypothetical protein